MPPCAPWATIADACAPCDAYDFDATLFEDFADVASEILFELSGRQYTGVCTTDPPVRPCAPACRRRHDECRTCGTMHQIPLRTPVVSVDQVKVDGAVLDSSLYRVDDERWLVRLPDPSGSNPGWPRCQRMDRADTEDDTWSITYQHGLAPPDMGVRAAAKLACELALACDPTTASECQLPERVTTIVRQGVTLTLLDPQDFLNDGRTGVYEVDLFLRTVNPHKLQRSATVWSPDIPKTTRRVDT